MSNWIKVTDIHRLSRPLAMNWSGWEPFPVQGAPYWVMTKWLNQTLQFMFLNLKHTDDSRKTLRDQQRLREAAFMIDYQSLEYLTTSCRALSQFWTVHRGFSSPWGLAVLVLRTFLLLHSSLCGYTIHFLWCDKKLGTSQHRVCPPPMFYIVPTDGFLNGTFVQPYIMIIFPCH